MTNCRTKQHPLPMLRWWLKTRPLTHSIQLGPPNILPVMEFYVPFWAWPFELLHRLIFRRIRLYSIQTIYINDGERTVGLYETTE